MSKLELAWEWKPAEDNNPNGTRPGNFQNTPLMIDNVLYVSTIYSRVVALDAETGKQLWVTTRKPGSPGNLRMAPGSCIAAWRPGRTVTNSASS